MSAQLLPILLQAHWWQYWASTSPALRNLCRGPTRLSDDRSMQTISYRSGIADTYISTLCIINLWVSDS